MIKELTGKRFGRWTVIRRSYPNGKNWRVEWLCKCDCGTERIVSGNHLKDGSSKSCGCFRIEQLIKNRRLTKGLSSLRAVMYNYKARAKRQKIKWSLTKEQFIELTQKNCYYCNTKPNNRYNSHNKAFGDYIYNGIDRIDNNKGYVTENVISCCKQCNRAKSNLTLQEFKDWIKKVFKNEKKKEKGSKIQNHT